MSKVAKLDSLGSDSPIALAAQWTEQFLNTMDGDFSVISDTGYEVVLRNKSACPGFKNGPCKNNLRCINIEKAIKRAVTFHDPGLDANFLNCSCDEGTYCEISIRSSS